VAVRTTETEAAPIELLPRVIEGWRRMVDGMEDLALHPDAKSEDVQEARERLANMLKVRMVPENGQLVAEVSLAGLGNEPSYIRMVAGARFGHCLLTPPRTSRTL
jgi:hypothetical protein